ncbi:hypothetical protein DUNSADRAFT_14808 [Dunaliella salina]|uniref:Uncharacterized protein n=1 Tax=Dunaliella salina TaxID=3046 RepID=A0ABQ7G6M8_DUNSA|nr:hypothetical protein DUNSADRAFT_14808 [Dunaliella salina]KAF5830269.1 hypothetical protein DUNSADRAFT_14808 [Dunaliella salina]|eukprot:KAF5830268.1 hypothetical protein DUNSADRAFT_14808 [Dunaliella salina]
MDTMMTGVMKSLATTCYQWDNLFSIMMKSLAATCYQWDNFFSIISPTRLARGKLLLTCFYKMISTHWRLLLSCNLGTSTQRSIDFLKCFGRCHVRQWTMFHSME